MPQFLPLHYQTLSLCCFSSLWSLQSTFDVFLVVISKILTKKGDFGYNAKNDTYENMLKAGIIDPTKVTRIALENAASVAGMLLTTECVLADIKEDNPSAAPMGAPGMGGGMPGMM